MNPESLQGFLLINKPIDVSSFDCIRHIKRIIKSHVTQQRIKIGHAGTLDPFASGLLIVAFSRDATKQIPHIHEFSKKYSASAQLGNLTTTLDKTGTVVTSLPYDQINLESLKASCILLQPGYLQTPPAYSALKHEGISLYEHVRNNRLSAEQLTTILEHKKRFVQVESLEITSCNQSEFTIEAQVSSGTYIRSLVNDIAQKLGTYATTHELTRTSIGPFLLSSAVELHDLTTIESIFENLISCEDFSKMLSK